MYCKYKCRVAHRILIHDQATARAGAIVIIPDGYDDRWYLSFAIELSCIDTPEYTALRNHNTIPLH